MLAKIRHFTASDYTKGMFFSDSLPMLPNVLDFLFFALMMFVVLTVAVFTRWPQAWLWFVVRLSRGRWLLRLLQLLAFNASGVQQLGYWLWDLGADRICLAGHKLHLLGLDGQWLEQPSSDFLSLVDVDDRPRLTQCITSIMESQDQFTIECRFSADGKVKLWVRLFGNVLLRDRQGRARIVFGRIEDISEHKVHVDTIAAINNQLRVQVAEQDAAIEAAERSACSLKLRLQQVLDTAPVALCWKDVDGIYLGCNQKFADLVQEPSPDSIQGKTDFDLVWKDSAATIVAEDRAVVTGALDLFEKEMERSDLAGQPVYMNRTTAPVRDGDKAVIGTFTTYDDISVHRRMESFAQKERKLMQEILDSSNAMITIIDRDYCFLRINKYFEVTTGLKAKDVVGRHLSEVIQGKKGKGVLAICDQIVATGLAVTEEYSVPTEPGGRRSFIANVTPVFDENGKVDKIVTVSTDVTELKLVQAQLEESRNKAEQAVSVKSRFLANMSHEIRTPMNAILGLSQLALATDLNPKQLDYLSKIHFSAENLLGIVNDILDFSKIEAGKLALEEKAFDLRVFMDNLCSIFEMKAKKSDLAFHRNISPNTPPFVRTDSLRLHQILVNLVGNAIKFTHSGSVTIDVGMRVDMGDRHILRFAIVDTGVGLTEAQMTQLFVAFEQADAGVTRQYGGTGLGLTISRRLVEMMGGEIKVSSVPGEGSRFEFTINVGSASPTDVMDLVAGDKVLANPDFQAATILLVEDNAVNLQVATEILAPLNLDIVTANNGAEAVEKVLAQPFALVLMDVQMPIMDGYSATIKIRETFSAEELPIIGLTANAMSEDKKASQEAGMNAHIAKPIDTAILFETLRRFLPEVIAPGPALAKQRKQPSDAGAVHSAGDADGYQHAVDFLPDLDLRDGLLRLRGRKDRYQELLLSFASQYKAGGKQAIALIEQCAFSEARALAHQIKGVAGNLSATRVYKESQALESLLIHGVEALDPEQAISQSHVLQIALDELAEIIDKLVNS